MIPEPQDPIALLGQPGVPPGIAFGFDGVVATVDLNDEIVLKTDEIDDVWAKHVLTAKLEPRKLTVAQAMPQQAFRIGGTPS